MSPLFQSLEERKRFQVDVGVQVRLPRDQVVHGANPAPFKIESWGTITPLSWCFQECDQCSPYPERRNLVAHILHQQIHPRCRDPLRWLGEASLCTHNGCPKVQTLLPSSHYRLPYQVSTQASFAESRCIRVAVLVGGWTSRIRYLLPPLDNYQRADSGWLHCLIYLQPTTCWMGSHAGNYMWMDRLLSTSLEKGSCSPALVGSNWAIRSASSKLPIIK